MARNSLTHITNGRKISTASAFIHEPLSANTDDRNWSWNYLRERFRIKDLEQLFNRYQQRLQHAMLIVYLLFQLFLSLLNIILLFAVEPFGIGRILPELVGHISVLVVMSVLLCYVHDESTFRQFPKLHPVISVIILATLFTSDVALTFYFTTESDITQGMDVEVKMGNVVYTVLVVYLFLPISRKLEALFLGTLLSIIHLTLMGLLVYDSISLPEKLVADALLLICINLVGMYSRVMNEIAFRRAFLDKRGCLEAKLKLETEKQQEESLLLSVLPPAIMHKVKEDFRKVIERHLNTNRPLASKKPFSELYISRHFPVSILFADICNFTPLTTTLKVDELVEMLNDLFGKFDEAAERNECLRIKILGDCYYCVSGVPEPKPKHANNCVEMGFDMIDIIREVREERSVNIDMRIGIHSGSVLSGLIGARKWQYDVWSHDVTIANYMEATGEAGRVHVTSRTREFLLGKKYAFEPNHDDIGQKFFQLDRIQTFLIVPRKRQVNHRISTPRSSSMTPKGRISLDQGDLSELYENDVSRRSIKVNLPQQYRTVLSRSRRSTVQGEAMLGSKRRTVLMDISIKRFIRIQRDSHKFMQEEIEKMPLRKADQWFHSEGIHPLFLSFQERSWGPQFLCQPDPLFKFYVLCACIVFITIATSHQILMPGNESADTAAREWYHIDLAPDALVSIACGLLLLFVLPVCWAPSLYIRIVDPYGDNDPLKKPRLIEALEVAVKMIIKSVILRVVLFLIITFSIFANILVSMSECNVLLEDRLLWNQTVTTETPVSSWYEESQTITSASAGTNNTSPDVLPALCCQPWYMTYSTALTMLAAWGFTRVHFLLKLFVYLCIAISYAVFASVMSPDLYVDLGGLCPPQLINSLALPVSASHVVFVVTIGMALHVMDRQLEYIMRLDFKWKQQLADETKESETTHFANKMLLQNILPVHVAEMYLNAASQQQTLGEVYHESYSHVAVLFASIPAFADFYRENETSEDGKKCLNVLNHIICDFDSLTYQPPYLSMEKIKVVGSTYMAACGLQPGRRYSDEEPTERGEKENISTIAHFAAEMFVKLDKINHDALQEFELRVGISVGPVIAGVVGTQKPMYDIWGDTVNVASRMDYTGTPGMLHVTERVGVILEELGWSVQCRGEIYVKGKNNMKTYFVDPLKVPKAPDPFTLNETIDSGENKFTPSSSPVSSFSSSSSSSSSHCPSSYCTTSGPTESLNHEPRASITSQTALLDSGSKGEGTTVYHNSVMAEGDLRRTSGSGPDGATSLVHMSKKSKGAERSSGYDVHNELGNSSTVKREDCKRTRRVTINLQNSDGSTTGTSTSVGKSRTDSILKGQVSNLTGSSEVQTGCQEDGLGHGVPKEMSDRRDCDVLGGVGASDSLCDEKSERGDAEFLSVLIGQDQSAPQDKSNNVNSDNISSGGRLISGTLESSPMGNGPGDSSAVLEMVRLQRGQELSSVDGDSSERKLTEPCHRPQGASGSAITGGTVNTRMTTSAETKGTSCSPLIPLRKSSLKTKRGADDKVGEKMSQHEALRKLRSQRTGSNGHRNSLDRSSRRKGSSTKGNERHPLALKEEEEPQLLPGRRDQRLPSFAIINEIDAEGIIDGENQLLAYENQNDSDTFSVKL